MANFYYTDANGQRGLLNEQQLKALAAQGIITPDTPLEAETGQKGKAGQIRGLFAAPQATPSNTAQYFYTDANGQKQGLFNLQILQALAVQGVITPQTPMETATGQRGLAGQIPGLFPSTPPPPTVDTGVEIKVYDYRRIASAHRLSAISILTFVLAPFVVLPLAAVPAMVMEGSAMADYSPLLSLLGILAIVIFSVVCMWRLARSIHYNIVSTVLFALCIFPGTLLGIFPGTRLAGILGFIPLFAVYYRAGKILEEAGYTVGLLGTNMRQFDDD